MNARIFTIAVLILHIPRTALAQNPTGPQTPEKLTPAEIYDRSSAAVVSIETFGPNDVELGSGTGFVICAEPMKRVPEWVGGWLELRGWRQPEHSIVVATNEHVIEPATRVKVTFMNGESTEKTLIYAMDDETDLAVLLLPANLLAPEEIQQAVAEGQSLRGYPYLVTCLPLHSDTVPPIGASVTALGNPLGLTNSLSTGIVAGHRVIEGSDRMQITTPIGPGSSGGPVLNESGLVVGVATSTMRNGQNLNFAVPAAAVQRILESDPKIKTVDEGSGWFQSISSALSPRVAFRLDYFDRNGEYPPDSFMLYSALLNDEAERGNCLAITLLSIEGYLGAVDGVALGERATIARGHLKQACVDCKDPAACILLAKEIGDEAELVNRPDAPASWMRERIIEARGYLDALRENLGVTLEDEHRAAIAEILARLALMRKEYAAALTELETAVRILPRRSELYELRAMTWAGLSNSDRLRDDIDRALHYDPSVHRLASLASVAGDAAEYGLALQLYDRAIERALETDKTWACIYKLNRASLLIDMNARSEFLSSMREVRACLGELPFESRQSIGRFVSKIEQRGREKFGAFTP